MMGAHRSFGLSISFGILGLLMVGLTMAITWTFGTTLGLSTWDKTIQGLSSVSVDAMGFMLAFALAVLIKWRRYAVAVVFTLPCLLYIGYSMQSVIGFGSVARVAKDQKITAEVTADKQSVQETNALLVQAKQDTLEWMRSTAYKRAQKQERGTLLKEIQVEAAKPVEFKTAKSEGIVGDPQAQQLAALLSGWGVTPATIQMGQVIWLAILLVMGKAIASFCTGYFWTTGGGGTRRVVETAPLREVSTSGSPPPRKVFAGASKTLAAEYEESVVAAVREDVEQEATWWKQVERFRREATYYDPEAQPKTSTDFYQHFSKWAQRAGVPEPFMSHNRFGRICTAMQVHKDNGDSKRPWYVGVALIPLPDREEREVPLAKVA